MRRMVQETNIHPHDFIYPIFTIHGNNQTQEIPSMPGVVRMTLDLLPKELEKVSRLGVPGVLLFGIPAIKDDVASEGYDPEGIVQKAVRKVKEFFPDLMVVTDLCLCEYTLSGHCGVVKNSKVLNDESLGYINKMAVAQAEAGSDMIAPSGMLDGRIKSIREALDSAGYQDVAIMSYAAKFASSFYGPFRDAAQSAPEFGDRRTYQMAPPNVRESLREIELDVKEGADIVMVKPAMSYLDVISKARKRWNVPIAAYNVSGEYSLVKAAAEKGWINERELILEILTSIKRAGADIIISYHALEASKWLLEDVNTF